MNPVSERSESLSVDQVSVLLRRATLASVTVASLLIVVKSAAWVNTGSVSVLSSLVDSLLDSLASFINFFAVRFALKPADHQHRFGHGKWEAVAAMGQALVIAASAAFLGYESVQRFVDPQPIQQGELGIAVMVFSIGITLVLVLYQRHVVKKTRSLAIDSDQLHYTGDILMNLAIIVSLICADFLQWTWADPLFGLLIAGYILNAARQILSGAMDMLLDRELPGEIRRDIFLRARGVEGVRGVHDLRTRRSGVHYLAQMHVELDPTLNLYDAHLIGEAVERTIQAVYPQMEILIHLDPEGYQEAQDGFDKALESGKIP
ncbi:cation diffusion facilitator family transporter [Acanthopleuribacter pedis]|uniref:Cation diffusion facilitator family transporter n=1 Tax=Acanthopleuribacter pedis TaxID=442870 RepID=A0A8J7QRU6_9BACT|nr:cation diffusion facilitator family transporter [Acanthopleuribacter pedis]MBO1323080.1 cation diffusion facilitator family transporter [Acanthopleuribacter pedis]